MLKMKKISETYDMKVFTDTGDYFGDVEESIMTSTKIFGWKVKATKNSFLNKVLGSAKGVIVPHQLVKAVGDILVRFFDQDGNLVETGLEKRVISMSLEELSKVGRAIGVAGGSRKYASILGALRGHWINILVTDHFTAKWLANE